jgi:hypothetical protein
MELIHIQLSAQDIARAFWEADYAPVPKMAAIKLEKPLESTTEIKPQTAVLPVE